MSRTRSAYHTINGYHYQFDKSIIEVLTATADEVITLENVEDIDVAAEVIQCKYHASKKYVPSAIKSPLAAFLKHYSANQSTLVYTLYAHFGEGQLPASLTLVELKHILGAELKKIGLADGQLQDFLSHRLRLIPGSSFEDQHDNTIRTIEIALNCAEGEARDYYYGNALHEIICLSRQPAPTYRQVTRSELIKRINRKRQLFSLWLMQVQGENDYVSYVRQAIAKKSLLNVASNKHFVINRSVFHKDGINGLAKLAIFLVDKYFALGRSLWNATPPTIVVDLEGDELLSLKNRLLEKYVRLNDGYEHLSFQPWAFDGPLVIRRKMIGSRVLDVIDDSSFVLRLVGLSTYDQHKSSLRSPDVTLIAGKHDIDIDVDATDVVQVDDVDSCDTLIAIIR